MASNKNIVVDGRALAVSGLFPRVVRMRSEHHDPVYDGAALVSAVQSGVKADLLTFMQPASEPQPRHAYHLEWDELAVLRFESYDSWWKQQLNDKTRNMIRKAAKKGVEIRLCRCDDEFVAGIKEVYDESPLRQGKPFKHYGKDIATLRDAHLSFADRSEFIGAYFEGKLIGFIKMVYHQKHASIMQIIAMFSHRDKAPTNALLSKAVELCAAKGLNAIHYGIWSRRSMGEFKKHHCFERIAIPRYYVPLNLRGKLALRLRFHRSASDVVPESVIDWMVGLRARWYAKKSATTAG